MLTAAANMRRILPLLTLLLALPAFATETAPTPAPAAPAAEEKKEDERASPDWYTESSVFGRSTGIPERAPFFTSGFGNGVVVGQDANGAFVDARDGRKLSDSEVSKALAETDIGGDGLGITILHGETSGQKGLNKGKFKDGSWEIAKGKLGKAEVEVASAWGYAAGGAAVGTDGLRFAGQTGGTLTLAGVNGSTKTVGFGKKDDRIKGAAEGYTYAMVGADASSASLVRIGPDGVAVGGRLGAFVGASTGVSGVGELDVAGVAVRVFAGASAGYGLGSDVYAFFKVDWASWAVRVGGQALAGFGPSAGAYVDVELSLNGLMKKLGVNDAIAKGVKRVAAAIKNGTLNALRGIGILSKPVVADGVAVARDAETAQAPAAAAVTQTGASSAGVSRD